MVTPGTRYTLAGAIVAAALAAACTGHRGDAAVHLDAAAAAGPVEQVVLTWTFCVGDLEVATRAAGGAWSAQPYRVPCGARRLVLPVSTETPEGAVLGFRARGAGAAGDSGWSEEARVQRAVRPAAGVTASQGIDERGRRVFVVQWQRTSRDADAVRLERQLRPPAGPPGPWTALPVAADATSYVDVEPAGPELATFGYRVTYLVGAIASAPAEAGTMAYGLAAPLDVSAVATVDAVTLSWTNASAAATEIRLSRARRGTFDLRAWTLARDATSVVDGALAPGVYEYLVGAATNAPWVPWSPSVQAAAVVQPPAQAAALPARAAYLPCGYRAARLASGAYAFAEPQGTFVAYPSYLHVETPSGWRTCATQPDVALLDPAPLVAADGSVHALYVSHPWTSSGAAPVHHLWLDGAGCHDELVAVLPTPSGSSAVVDAAGGVHLLAGGATRGSLGYVPPAGSVLGPEQVPVSAASAVTLAAPLALATDGTPVAIARVDGAAPAYRLLTRSAAGWSVEPIPDDAVPPEPGLDTIIARDDALTWVYARWSGLAYDVRVRERRGGAWQPSRSIGVANGTPVPGLGVARSPDGTRLAVAAGGRAWFDPHHLLVSSADGTVDTQLLPSEGSPVLGFLPDGRLWVVDALFEIDGGCGTSVHAVYEEP